MFSEIFLLIKVTQNILLNLALLPAAPQVVQDFVQTPKVYH